MTEDELREMLRTKAAEVRVSDDAWAKISARIQEAPARPVGRRLALAGAAAAAVAGTVFVANLPGPTSQVATPDTTTSVPAESGIAPSSLDPVVVATQWLQDRFPEVDVVAGELQGSEDGNATVVFREGGVQTEVFVRQLSGREGWAVVAATSDMIPLFDVTYDGRDLQGRATPEAAGRVVIDYVLDGDAQYGGVRDVAAREDVALGWQTSEAAEVAAVRVVLVVDDVRYLSEVTAGRVVDPAVATGSYVAVWPATDSAGLAELQRQADDGFRPDLLDPQAVAGAFLAELLPRDESPTSYTVGDFQQGDTTSGEVPYILSDGASGTILVRTTGEDGAIWFVSGATSDDLEIVEARREETHLVADVRSGATGTLTWTGATPVAVEAGQLVSIGRPDTPLGGYPIVVRLVDGDRTLAIAARLG